MKLKVAAWRRSYKQQDKIQDWKKDYTYYRMLVTSEQVEKYENGVNACTAKSLFPQLSKGKTIPVSQQKYC